MFKSTFAKYLTAFVIIILISFLMLSGLITTMIKSYVNENKERSLLATSEAIVSSIRDAENLSQNELLFQRYIISTLLKMDQELQVMITDENGLILLTTITDLVDEEQNRIPDISHEYGSIDVSHFDLINKADGGTYLVHYGNLGGIVDESHIACAKEISSDGDIRGYVICLASTEKEDQLIGITRRAVINSSAWVMLAAVIAIYFITERIIHPLKNMTKAAKQFAKGDFESRVTVNGEDEVSELGRAFNHMAESLENLEKMRNSFLANVSHDLRTPMTTIAGFIDGITSGAIPQEKHEYYLNVISVEVHRLSRLVSELLDISRLESGDRKFEFIDFDVAEVARLILISFESKIDEKNLDVEFDVEEDSVFAKADKDAIYQVLYNLCHNAIKFSCNHGKFKIGMSKKGGKIEVRVFNSGQVIPEDDIPMIFERFYKSDKSRGLDKSGVGLGLYICKTIIDAHGESISVESNEGIGTEFAFTLKLGENNRRKVTPTE